MDTASNDLQGSLSPSEQAQLPAFQFEWDAKIAGRSIPMTLHVFGEWEPGWNRLPQHARTFYISRLECLDEDVTKWLEVDDLRQAIYTNIYGSER